LSSIDWIANRIEALRNDAFRLGEEQSPLAGVMLSLLGDSSQYLVGVVAMGLANVLLLPLYTRFLNQSDFGLYALIEVLALSLIAISGLGFTVSYLKNFAASGPGEVSKLLGTMLLVNGLLAAITGAGLSFFLASPRSAHLLRGDAHHFAWLLLPLILLESLQGVLLTHLRARRKAVSFSWASAVRLLGIASISIWLVAGRGEGLAGVFKARVMGDVLACLVLWGLTASDLSLSASFSSAWSMAKYGLPVMGSALMMMILDGAGRFFLDRYGNLEQVGLYSVGVKISGVMRLSVVVPFGAAWGGVGVPDRQERTSAHDLLETDELFAGAFHIRRVSAFFVRTPSFAHPGYPGVLRQPCLHSLVVTCPGRSRPAVSVFCRHLPRIGDSLVAAHLPLRHHGKFHVERSSHTEIWNPGRGLGMARRMGRDYGAIGLGWAAPLPTEV